jgi:polyhydroxybutyrate depolymerase
VDFWVKNNACNPVPETSRLPHHGSQSGTRTHADHYRGPTPQSDVVLYTVERGGHTWPGGPLMQEQWSLGRVSRDFKATEVIWQFFKEHPKAD